MVRRSPANDRATHSEKSFVHIGSTFIAHTQPAKLMQPGERALNYPTRQAKITTVSGASFADLGPNAALSQAPTNRFTVVAVIGLHAFRFSQRASAPASDGRHAVKQCQELGRVVTVGTCQNDVQQWAASVGAQNLLERRFDRDYSILLDALKTFNGEWFSALPRAEEHW
jgi:hypothetical protein